MHNKLIISCVLLGITAIILSCVDSNPVGRERPEEIPVIIDSLPQPVNVKVDSLRIVDTSYYFESLEIAVDTVIVSIDTLNDTDIVYTYRYDTTITITTINLDSILASFVVSWDPVTGAEQYFVYVHDSAGSVVRILKTYVPRIFVGGLRPNRTYMFNIAAGLDSLIITTTVTDGKTTYDTTRYCAISKKTDSRFVSLYLPNTPDNLTVSHENNTALVSWDPVTDNAVIGYRVFLYTVQGSCIDSTDTLPPQTRSTSFTVVENTVYTVNIITIDSIGVSVMDSIYPYDITTGSDSCMRLPYLYLSTYKKPENVTSSIAGNLIGVKGGVFIMGDIWVHSAESHPGRPAHEVVVSSFYLGEKEITTGEYVTYLNHQNQLGFITNIRDTVYHFDTTITFWYDTTYDYDTSFINDSMVITKTINSISVDSSDTAIAKIIDDTVSIFLSGTDTLLYKPLYVDKDSTVDSFVVYTGKSNCPITGVVWQGAAAYCNWLSSLEKLTPCYTSGTWAFDSTANGYRIPTEAEFEYAHSAAFLGTKQRYPWGYRDDNTRYSSSTTGPTDVAKYTPYFGFYDLSGNVMEWCTDWGDFVFGVDSSSYYGECLHNGIVSNPSGPSLGEYHVARGGSYKSVGEGKSSAWRHSHYTYDYSETGFRVARSKK